MLSWRDLSRGPASGCQAREVNHRPYAAVCSPPGTRTTGRLRAVDQVVADAAQHQVAQWVESLATGYDELRGLSIGDVQQDVGEPAIGHDAAVDNAGRGQRRAPVLLEAPPDAVSMERVDHNRPSLVVRMGKVDRGLERVDRDHLGTLLRLGAVWPWQHFVPSGTLDLWTRRKRGAAPSKAPTWSCWRSRGRSDIGGLVLGSMNRCYGEALEAGRSRAVRFLEAVQTRSATRPERSAWLSVDNGKAGP